MKTKQSSDLIFACQSCDKFFTSKDLNPDMYCSRCWQMICDSLFEDGEEEVEND
jgi:hypothetical protein